MSLLAKEFLGVTLMSATLVMPHGGIAYALLFGMATMGHDSAMMPLLHIEDLPSPPPIGILGFPLQPRDARPPA